MATQFVWDDGPADEDYTFNHPGPQRVGVGVRAQAAVGLATWWSNAMDAAMMAQLGGHLKAQANTLQVAVIQPAHARALGIKI